MTEARVRDLGASGLDAAAAPGGAGARNEELAATLASAKTRLVALREDLDRAAMPPLSFGVCSHAMTPPRPAARRPTALRRCSTCWLRAARFGVGAFSDVPHADLTPGA